MSVGIRNIFVLAAPQTFTNNNTLANLSGVASPIAANQRQIIRIWIPVTTGATGGAQYRVVVPAGGTLFRITTRINNQSATQNTTSTQTSSTAVGNALASPASHFIEATGIIINGATPGFIQVQAAQNTVDANTLTIQQGAFIEATIF
jgi:hypothetical protein